ncbi:hypothetical protein GBA63_09210 [Rubrobacter tropicus]|uniref:Uncharacterized protein n=1 Tax=Rubrobacter tropicus TaxID=2653851 RepID=A0A6G8Q8K7_9ACTN|nr:hypothetical protein [Rubrobacter tropicus]QIN82810.1 hypothetical protein GBA63_09210 [Rubrobacter tropicus]
MVEVADRAVEAAWKVRNLEDFDRRLARAARRLDEVTGGLAAMVVYETALMKSGRPPEEVRKMVRSFRDAFEDEEEPLTIAHTSGIMNVEGNDWFFGDGALRVLTGKLLGQFQHRVAQYNYVDEREVLRRWADGYDTRLFVRRRIFETEPVIGVVGGLDLYLLQHLRVAAGGNTLVPGPDVAGALEALGYRAGADPYETLAAAEDLALRLDLPAPVVGEMLAELGREGFRDYPEPPRGETQETPSESSRGEEIASEGGAVSGGAADEPGEQKPVPPERAERAEVRGDPASGEEPSRVQDPQAKDAPGVAEEEGPARKASPPGSGRQDEPGTSGREDA